MGEKKESSVLTGPGEKGGNLGKGKEKPAFFFLLGEKGRVYFNCARRNEKKRKNARPEGEKRDRSRRNLTNH